MKVGFVIAIALGSMLPLLAHHSLAAEYDLSKTATIQGTVIQVEWMNPHARLFLDVADGDGKVTRWEVEMGSPNGLMIAGWTRDTIKQGDRISADVSKAKEGTKALACARSVTLADGRTIDVGDRWGMPGEAPAAR